MTRSRRLRSTVLLGLFACPALAAIALAVPAQDDPPVARWSDAVWTSAIRGDESSLIDLLGDLPEDAEASAAIDRLRENVTLQDTNRTKATADRTTAREEALAEMREHVAAGDLDEAIRSAIRYQDLGEDFDSVFAEKEVNDIIEWASGRLPEIERNNDWLGAQELLYMLRTLYEDTDRSDLYSHYDKKLDAVNRRLSLLAFYAPKYLHDMRVAHAERKGDEPLGPYTPANDEWRERIAGASSRTLKGALRLAAHEHIETEGGGGWRTLLKGGLEALSRIATTPGLETTFPSLSDPQRIEDWLSAIDDEAKTLRNVRDDRIDTWTLQKMLDRLVKQNEETVKLPTDVVYREFGDGAVSMLDKLYDDPYSEIIWPNKLRRFRQATEGNFVGVGILIRHNEKREIEVINPLEGTPAYFAGVKPNDLIVEVDGEGTVGWSLNDAVDRITGPKGKEVLVGVRREGVEDVVPIPIIRDVIKLRTVKGWHKSTLDGAGDPVWDWFVDPDSRIAYIRVTQFTDDTYDDLRKAWEAITAEHRPNGLILDLRYNPGGLLTSAVQISNLLVPDGIIVTGEDKHGNRAFPDQRADPRAEMLGVPTAVLVNKGSASASEIVAGCLQAHGKAVVVGERSYGKGSVQTVHIIARDARMKLTTHYYRLPPQPGETRGRLVHKRPGADMWGVEPDIIVRMPSILVRDALELRRDADIIPTDDDGRLMPDSPERPAVTDLLTEGLDPQLQMALVILQARALTEPTERHARR